MNWIRSLCLGRFFGFVEWSLQAVFCHNGISLGNNPLPFFICPLFLMILSSAELHQMTEEGRSWYFSSPTDDALSQNERAIANEYFEEKGGIFELDCGIMAKDGGSLLREGYLEAANQLLDYIQQNLSVTHEELDYTYADLCDIYCQDN